MKGINAQFLTFKDGTVLRRLDDSTTMLWGASHPGCSGCFFQDSGRKDGVGCASVRCSREGFRYVKVQP